MNRINVGLFWGILANPFQTKESQGVKKGTFCFFVDRAFIVYLFLMSFYPLAIAVRDIVIAAVRLSVRPSVTLSRLCDNLSKHGWI